LNWDVWETRHPFSLVSNDFRPVPLLENSGQFWEFIFLSSQLPKHKTLKLFQNQPFTLSYIFCGSHIATGLIIGFDTLKKTMINGLGEKPTVSTIGTLNPDSTTRNE
jgi:hypothetical protein